MAVEAILRRNTPPCRNASVHIERYLKTIDEIMNDVATYDKGLTDHARVFISYLGHHIFEEGLEVNMKDLPKELHDHSINLLPYPLEFNEKIVSRVVNFLMNNNIIMQISNENNANSSKFVFTDPRYAIGAYLYNSYLTKPEGYVNTYNDLYNSLCNGDFGKYAHYIEALVLSNVALGIYAMRAAEQKANKSETMMKKYVRFYKDGNIEHDGIAVIDKKVKYLIEVSISHDEHTEKKCRDLDPQSNSNYKGCFYFVLNPDPDNSCVSVDERSDYIFVEAPLPLLLLLF